jgi:hypothetical protein
MLATAAGCLEPGGLLVIGVPNLDSLQFRLLGSRWAHVDAPRHLCLIPKKALVQSLGALGLTPVDATTSDPFGLLCNRVGWTCSIHRRPASGDPSPAVRGLVRALRLALGPLERRGNRGASLTMLFRKGAPV